MTRECAKKNIEVIKAFAEGNNIQMLEVDGTTWSDIKEPYFSETIDYRIKPKQEYEPWTTENCPLKCGDVLFDKFDNKFSKLVTGIDISEDSTEPVCVNGEWYPFQDIFDGFVMVDGTPCGEKVDDCPVADDNDKYYDEQKEQNK